MVLTPLPNTTVQTSGGAVVGGGSLVGGLVIAFAGSFPTGPVFDPGNPSSLTCEAGPGALPGCGLPSSLRTEVPRARAV